MNWRREVCMRINLERLFQRPDAQAAVVCASEGHNDHTVQEDTADLAGLHLNFTADYWEGTAGTEDHPSRWIAMFLSEHAGLALPGPDGSRIKTDLCFTFEGVGEGTPACLVTTEQKVARLPNGPFVRAQLACVTAGFGTCEGESHPVHAWYVMAMILSSVEENSGGQVFVLDHEVGRLPENEHFRVRPSYEHGECFECRICGQSYATWEMGSDLWENDGCWRCPEAEKAPAE